MSLNRPLIILLLVAVLVGTALWRLSGDRVETVRRTRIIMGTLVEITAIGEDRARMDRAIGAAFGEMSRIEQLMSGHVEDSEVSRLAKVARSMDVSDETAVVIRAGLEIVEKSDGAFSLILGQLIDAWDILADEPRIPTPDQVTTAMIGLTPEGLQLQGATVIKAHPALKVDLGGIAKGYAVDRAFDQLQQAGLSHFSVNAGGDLRIKGDRGGRPWRIGIQHPRQPETVLAILPAADEAVVTSGDYERYFERDGVRYHHLLDPRTGQPARAVQSITVSAPTTMLADGLATAAFVLGPKEGLALLEEWSEVEGLIIAADGSVHTTSGMKDRLQWP